MSDLANIGLSIIQSLGGIETVYILLFVLVAVAVVFTRLHGTVLFIFFHFITYWVAISGSSIGIIGLIVCFIIDAVLIFNNFTKLGRKG